jgi:hypothetical protein
MNRDSLLHGIIALALVPCPARSQNSPVKTAVRRDSSMPVPITPSTAGYPNRTASTATFVENQGQFDPKVKFQATIGGKTAWLTTGGIVFDVVRDAQNHISDGSTIDGAETTSDIGGHPIFDRPAKGLRNFERLVFAEDLVKANCCATLQGKAPQPEINSYFLGKDTSKWRTSIPVFAEVIYRDIWPSIDLRVYGNGQNFEQEFIVRPGGDLRLVQIAYRGVKALSVSNDGSLAVATAFGTLRETKPRIFQIAAGRRSEVNGRYKLTGPTSYTFDVPSPNRLYTLVIDPTLLFSTYIGGSGQGIYSENGIAVDASGNAYITGTTLTSTYPTTVGSFQSSCPSASCSNIYTPFVSKFDPVGRLQYSTFLGSTGGQDVARAIAVNANGEAYITGHASTGFPTTSSAFQSSCDGVFMTKLNFMGTALLYSTCLGYNTAYSDLSYAVGARLV